MKLPADWTDNGSDYVVYEASTGVFAAAENRDELLWMHPLVARRIVRLEEELERADRIIALARAEARRQLGPMDDASRYNLVCDILEILEGE